MVSMAAIAMSGSVVDSHGKRVIADMETVLSISLDVTIQGLRSFRLKVRRNSDQC